MLDFVHSPISDLVGRRKPWHTLEAPFYRSDDIFRLDLDLIFGRHWIYVGVEPDVPEPGDVMVVDIGSNSVLILRDDDMQVRAFHNVCRHRGARLVEGPKGTVGNLVCRYHSWTYGLDGRLLHAQHMGEGFDTSCRGLKPVHLRAIAGLLFICLSDDPPSDIEDMAQAITPYVAPHDIAGTKIAKQIDIVEHGNWKLTMENNRECYHCSANHPELTVPLFAYGFGFEPKALDDAERAQVERYGCMVSDLHAKWEGSRPAFASARPSDRLRHRLPHRAAAAGPGGREPHHRHARRLPQAARRPQRSETRRPVVVDGTELLAPFHGRPYRHLLRPAARCGPHAAAHEMAGEQGGR